MIEQVYNRYYDTVGNYHWTGVHSGEHIVRKGERMSVSLWRWTEECDKHICPGDCDLCSYEEESEEECCANCKFCYPLEHRLPQETEWEWHHVCTALAYGDDGFAMQIDNPSEGKCEIFKPRKEREDVD